MDEGAKRSRFQIGSPNLSRTRDLLPPRPVAGEVGVDGVWITNSRRSTKRLRRKHEDREAIQRVMRELRMDDFALRALRASVLQILSRRTRDLVLLRLVAGKVTVHE